MNDQNLFIEVSYATYSLMKPTEPGNNYVGNGYQAGQHV